MRRKAPATELEKVAPDHAVAELSSRRPRLRHDVRFSFHEHAGRPSYVLEDVAKRKYYQVGLPEYQFLISLDGTRSVRELLAKSARISTQAAIGETQAQTILRWAIDHELLESDNVDQDHRRGSHAAEQERKKPKQILGAVMFPKIPLGNPDPFLRVMERWFGWIASPFFFLIWLGVVAAAAFQMAVHWRAFATAAGAAVLPGNWLLLLVTFSLLKLIHEIGHGIVAKRFKTPVPEWGIRLLCLVSPLTYVDASASWRLPTRFPRICIAAAGMYVEVFIAALAVFLWVNTEAGFLNTWAYNVIFAASVVTVLFNANPLMRFDGYYILSDLAQIPNLAQKGQRTNLWIGKRYILGLKDEILPQTIAERGLFIGTYGILSKIWMTFMWLGIFWMAGSLFFGAGIVLVALGLIGGLFTTVKTFLTFLGKSRGRLKPAVAGVRIAALAAVLILPFILVPVSPSPKIAAVVHYPEKAVLRVECPGFVKEILCQNNQKVTKGDILIRLENPLKTSELAQLELDIKRTQLQAESYNTQGIVASYQSELENLKSLRKKRESLSDLLASLEFKAPRDGVVHGDRIDTLPGTYLQPGDSVVTVLPTERPDLLLSIAESDIDAVNRRQSDEVDLVLSGRGGETVRGKLSRIEQRATIALPHLALGAASGGPLVLRQRATTVTERRKGLAIDRNAATDGPLALGRGAEEEALANQELIAPRLLAHATIESQSRIAGNTLPVREFREGEWGYAELVGGQRYRLGEWLIDKISIFMKGRADRARAMQRG